MGFLDYVIKSLGFEEGEKLENERIKKNVRNLPVSPKQQKIDWPTLTEARQVRNGSGAGRALNRCSCKPGAQFNAGGQTSRSLPINAGRHINLNDAGCNANQNSDANCFICNGLLLNTVAGHSSQRVEAERNRLSGISSDLKPLFKKSEKNIAIFEPKNLGEIKAVTNFIKQDNACVVILSGLNQQEQEKCVNFFLGAVFALDGRLENINDGTFLFAPKEMVILT